MPRETIQDGRGRQTVHVGWQKDDGAVQVAVTATESPESGYWMDLTREDCNRLIALVRKARDGAFGRDE